MKTELVSLKDILPDTTYQFRDTSAGKNVAELCRLISDDIELDPVILWKNSRGYLILDGFQRVEATRKIKGVDAKIRAVVKKMQENCENVALDIAIAANQKHGGTFERADRKKAAIRLLEFNPEEYDTVIAKKVGLSPRTIANYREEVDGAKISTRRNEKGAIVNVRKPNGKEEAQVNQKHPAELNSKQTSKNTGNSKESIDGKNPLESSEAASSSPEGEKIMKGTAADSLFISGEDCTSCEDLNIQSSLSTIANICRMQARELERRADFIEKLKRRKVFKEAELELILCVAEDAEVMEPADSFHWHKNSEELKTICVFISQLLATDNQDEEGVAS